MSSVDHDTLILRAGETRDYAAALADAAIAYRELRSSE